MSDYLNLFKYNILWFNYQYKSGYILLDTRLANDFKAKMLPIPLIRFCAFLCQPFPGSTYSNTITEDPFVWEGRVRVHF